MYLGTPNDASFFTFHRLIIRCRSLRCTGRKPHSYNKISSKSLHHDGEPPIVIENIMMSIGEQLYILRIGSESPSCDENIQTFSCHLPTKMPLSRQQITLVQQKSSANRQIPTTKLLLENIIMSIGEQLIKWQTSIGSNLPHSQHKYFTRRKLGSTTTYHTPSTKIQQGTN